MSIRADAILAAADRAPAAYGAVAWSALLPDVARRLLADRPCREHGGDLRYGSRGSLVLHPQTGSWHDFETGAGGGVLDLVEHLLQTDRAGALQWLVDERLIAPPSGPDARPAAPRLPGGISTPPAPPAPKSNAMADVADAILAAAVPADDTPARAYLARRRTWPLAGPDLPPAVRWLPPSAWAHLPTWPGPDGRPRRLTPPRDGMTHLVAGAPPVPACGAVVFELARPGCAPDAVQLEAVTAVGHRLAWTGNERDTKRTPGNKGGGRTFEIAAPTGDPWPDADAAPLVVAVVEGPADALALARLRLPGVLVRAAAGTGGMGSGGAALVADLPAATAACLVSDGDRPGRGAVTKLHAALHAAGRTCYAAVLIGGDLDELLRGAADVDLADRHGERAAILEHDGGLPRPAATARTLARMLETLTRRNHD